MTYNQIVFELGRLTQAGMEQVCCHIEAGMIEATESLTRVNIDYYGSGYIMSDRYGLYVFTLISDRELTPVQLIVLSEKAATFPHGFAFSKVFGFQLEQD